MLQNSFRIITHEIWKVEMILKSYWKFSATIGAVWVYMSYGLTGQADLT